MQGFVNARMSVGEDESAADVRKFSWLCAMCERGSRGQMSVFLHIH